MKRLLKGCVILLVAGMGLLLLAGFILYATGLQKLKRSYPVTSVETVTIPQDADAVAHGKHIAIIWSCTKCHGDDLGGKLIANSSFSGIIPASNLTSGDGGIAASYSDADWVHAIRYGIKPNGRAEILMNNYWTLSDQDLGDLLAYLKQLPPVNSNQPPMRFGIMTPIMAAIDYRTPAAERIDPNVPRPALITAGATIEYGQYLSAVCTECHQAKNIGVALKDWSQDDFVRAFHNGILPNGNHLDQAMPLKTYGELNQEELTALWLYFHSLRPASE
jgi:mono/diheme cytochrome c family protein